MQLSSHLNSLTQVIKQRNVFLLLILVSITVTPLLFWGPLYYVGEDDTKLYYLFPSEYINNYAINIVSDNHLGGLASYYPQAFSTIPFIFLIFILKNIFFFLNIQLLMFGLNLSLGFYFFYLLSAFWVKLSSFSFWLRIIAAFSYVFSIFIYFTIGALWLNIYLISVVPATLYFFLTGIKQQNVKRVILSAIVFSLFGNFLSNIPWLAGWILALVPFLLAFGFSFNMKIFTKYSAIFLVCVLLLNTFVIVHLFNVFTAAPENSLDMASRVLSNTDKEANATLINAVAKSNRILDPVFNLFHYGLQRDFQWTSLPLYLSWYAKLILVNIFLLSLIISAFFFLKRESTWDRIAFYTIFSGWLIALFMFTANVGDWGLDAFLFLNEKLPGFSMFRNMYDKFAFPLAFTFAALLGASAGILIQRISVKFKSIIITLFFLAVFLNSLPFVFATNFKQPFRGTTNTYNSIKQLDSDYVSLARYLQETTSNGSHIVWLPIVANNYIAIPDDAIPNHAYVGPSPLQIFSGEVDFTGQLSFFSFGNQLMDSIVDQNFAETGRFLQRMNVEYLVLNDSVSTDLIKSSLYSYERAGDLIAVQSNKDFFDEILGEKIINFGKYSFFHINPKYASKKLYLTDNVNIIPNNFSNLSYEKVSASEYKITIDNLTNTRYLVFLDPYHPLWQLRVAESSNVIAKETHHRVLTYANGWLLSSSTIQQNLSSSNYSVNEDGSIRVELILNFKSDSVTVPGIIVSMLSLIAMCIYLVWPRSSIAQVRNPNFV